MVLPLYYSRIITTTICCQFSLQIEPCEAHDAKEWQSDITTFVNRYQSNSIDLIEDRLLSGVSWGEGPISAILQRNGGPLVNLRMVGAALMATICLGYRVDSRLDYGFRPCLFVAYSRVAVEAWP